MTDTDTLLRLSLGNTRDDVRDWLPKTLTNLFSVPAVPSAHVSALSMEKFANANVPLNVSWSTTPARALPAAISSIPVTAIFKNFVLRMCPSQLFEAIASAGEFPPANVPITAEVAIQLAPTPLAC
jgi:hypothetical protein